MREGEPKTEEQFEDGSTDQAEFLYNESPKQLLVKGENFLQELTKGGGVVSKDDFLRKASEAGLDVADKTKVRVLGYAIIGEVNQLFGENYGLAVPRQERDFPGVFIDEKGQPGFIQNHGKKSDRISSIRLRGINDVLNGNYLGEEIAHFYRRHFGPEEPKEEITDEFFGFLGKMLWQKSVAEGKLGCLDFLMSQEEQEIYSKKQVLAFSKDVKEKIESLEGKPEKDESTEAEIKGWENKRKDILVHQRGYEYASKISLDKISDFKKLFSMPNKEVRKRFFTDNPDYSGL